MPNTLVPKVQMTEAAESLSVPQNNILVIGILAQSQKGEANVVKQISSVSQADAIFGSNYSCGANLVPMIRKAFAEGASVIKAISIGQPKKDLSTYNYETLLQEDTLVGATSIEVPDATFFKTGDRVTVDSGTASAETVTLAADGVGTTVTVPALSNAHTKDAVVTTLNGDDNASLQADVEAGEDTIVVGHGSYYSAGDIVYLGTGFTYDKEEKKEVLSVSSNSVKFTTPLLFKHYIGEKATIVAEDVTTEYDDAITAILEDENKGAVICQLNDDETANKLENMCWQSYYNYNTPCVYIREPEADDTDAIVIANAQSHNTSRVMCPFPLFTAFNGKKEIDGLTAAGFAGALAGNGVPKLNHNFTKFKTVGGVTEKITDMDALISAGVTPIEFKKSEIYIVRFVTTETRQNGVPYYVWREGAVRLNVDYIEKDIADAVQAKFMQVGNTQQTRDALKEEIIVKLKKYESQNIIVPDVNTNTPAYKEPVVSVDPSDNTAVDVDIEISPGKPLNFINLNFKVYI